MATTFQAELDGTNGVAVTANATDGGNSGFDGATGGWVFDTSVKASGTASAKLVLTAGTGMLTRTHTNSPVSTRGYDFMGRISALDGGNVMLAQIKLGATNLAHLDFNATGQLLLKNVNTTVDTSATTFNVNEWYRIQWFITGTTQSVRLWVAGTVAGLFNATPTETMSGTYTGGSWDAFKVGCNVTHTLTLWVDRVVIDDSGFPAIGATGNAIPTANAGADQAKTSGQTTTLNGTGSADSDGTIASYLWRQVSGPSVTLSSTTTASPTFTAPAVAASTDLVFGLRVTDNGGAQSTEDTVTITVSPGGATPTDDYYELLNAGPNAATVTTSNTTLNTVDAGITFTTAAIGEGSFAATASPVAASLLMVHVLPSAVSEYWFDAVYQLSNLAAGPWYLMRVASGATARAWARIDTDGGLRLRNGSTAVGTVTTAKVTAGQPFRVAWHCLNGGNMDARLFTGANLWGTTPDTGGTTSGAQNTGTFDRVAFGNGPATTNTGTWIVDSIRCNATAYPAPISGGGIVVQHSNLKVMQADGTWLETDLTFF